MRRRSRHYRDEVDTLSARHAKEVHIGSINCELRCYQRHQIWLPHRHEGLLSQHGPRFFEQLASQAIEFILLWAHPIGVLKYQILKAANPAVEPQYAADCGLLSTAIA